MSEKEKKFDSKKYAEMCTYMSQVMDEETHKKIKEYCSK
jgi:hypothetical protein